MSIYSVDSQNNEILIKGAMYTGTSSAGYGRAKFKVRGNNLYVYFYSTELSSEAFDTKFKNKKVNIENIFITDDHEEVLLWNKESGCVSCKLPPQYSTDENGLTTVTISQ